MALILLDSGLMPCLSTSWPRKLIFDFPNSHFYNQAVGLKTFKENLQMIFVFLIGSTSNQYIIQVVEDEIEAMENLIHKALKCLCCVFQSKWHT